MVCGPDLAGKYGPFGAAVLAMKIRRLVHSILGLHYLLGIMGWNWVAVAPFMGGTVVPLAIAPSILLYHSCAWIP